MCPLEIKRDTKGHKSDTELDNGIFYGNQFQDRESFDSRSIMETWPERNLGTVEFSELHLSQRRAGRRTTAGYYLPSAVVQINSCS